jgi:hypothetical protein
VRGLRLDLFGIELWVCFECLILEFLDLVLV